jgi:hypothetical protein
MPLWIARVSEFSLQRGGYFTEGLNVKPEPRVHEEMCVDWELFVK